MSLNKFLHFRKAQKFEFSEFFCKHKLHFAKLLINECPTKAERITESQRKINNNRFWEDELRKKMKLTNIY